MLVHASPHDYISVERAFPAVRYFLRLGYIFTEQQLGLRHYSSNRFGIKVQYLLKAVSQQRLSSFRYLFRIYILSAVAQWYLYLVLEAF